MRANMGCSLIRESTVRRKNADKRKKNFVKKAASWDWRSTREGLQARLISVVPGKGRRQGTIWKCLKCPVDANFYSKNQFKQSSILHLANWPFFSPQTSNGTDFNFFKRTKYKVCEKQTTCYRNCSENFAVIGRKTCLFSVPHWLSRLFYSWRLKVTSQIKTANWSIRKTKIVSIRDTLTWWYSFLAIQCLKKLLFHDTFSLHRLDNKKHNEYLTLHFENK